MGFVRYTESFKASAVAAYASGTPVRSIAKCLGVSVPAVYQWIAASKGNAPADLATRVRALEARITELELRA